METLRRVVMRTVCDRRALALSECVLCGLLRCQGSPTDAPRDTVTVVVLRYRNQLGFGGKQQLRKRRGQYPSFFFLKCCGLLLLLTSTLFESGAVKPSETGAVIKCYIRK